MILRLICICFLLALLTSCYVYDVNNTYWKVPNKIEKDYALYSLLSKPNRTTPLIPLGILITTKHRKNYDFHIGLLSKEDSYIVKVINVNYKAYNHNDDILFSNTLDDSIKLENFTENVVLSDKSYKIPELEAMALGDSIFVTANILLQLKNDTAIYKKTYNCTLVKDRHHGFSRFF